MLLHSMVAWNFPSCHKYDSRQLSLEIDLKSFTPNHVKSNRRFLDVADVSVSKTTINNCSLTLVSFDMTLEQQLPLLVDSRTMLSISLPSPTHSSDALFLYVKIKGNMHMEHFSPHYPIFFTTLCAHCIALKHFTILRETSNYGHSSVFAY